MAKTRVIYRNRFSKKRTHHRRKFTLPLAVMAGLSVPVIGTVQRISTPAEIPPYLVAGFTGLGADGQFNFANLRAGAFPVMAGMAAHWIASKLGVNRALGQAGVPFIRI